MIKVIGLLALVGTALGGRPSVRPTLPANVTHLPAHPPKILNGVDAEPGQFPYIVSLNYVGDGHACGGSIITADWVLTAAHCCLTGYPLDVYVGSIYLSQGGKTYPIRQYVIHGDYDPDSHWANDICLINVGNSIQLSQDVTQVSLPLQDQAIPSGAPLVIPGWGSDENGNGPDRLQVLNDDIALSNEECTQQTGVDIIDGQICASAGPNKAVCSGDSGGPLSLTGARVQVGIVSWGFVPCGSGLPDMFTRVPHYVNWILQVVGLSAKDIKWAKPEDFL